MIWSLNAQGVEKHPDYIRGNVALTEGQFQTAALAFEQALLQFPDAPKLWYNLGTAYYRGKNYVPALQSYQKVLRLDSLFPRAHLNTALCLIQTGNFNQAKAYFQISTRLAPATFEGLYFLGALALQADNADSAYYFYSKCLDQWPDFAPALHDKGWILWQRGDINGAHQLVSKALQLQPDHPVYLTTFSHILRARFQGEQALQMLKPFANQWAEHPTFQMVLGSLAFERGDIDLAIACFNRVDSLLPHQSEVLLNLSSAHIALGNDLEALKILGELEKKKPEWGPAALNTGIVYENLFQLDKACRQWDIAQKQGIQKANRYLKERCEDTPASLP
jgi:tetratricopeptide (TPR) repeat protein